jgi:hypothetical protein
MVKKETKPSVKKMDKGIKAPKAKVVKSVADNTRVKKPVLNNTKAPKYSYLEYAVENGKKPTARDSAEYRFGYNAAVSGKKVSDFDLNMRNAMGKMEGETYSNKGRIISKPVVKTKKK